MKKGKIDDDDSDKSRNKAKIVAEEPYASTVVYNATRTVRVRGGLGEARI